MPSLATEIFVKKCPKDKKKVNVTEACEAPGQHCPFFAHFAYRGNRVYVVCIFNQPPKREECVLESPSDPELAEMEGETASE